MFLKFMFCKDTTLAAFVNGKNPFTFDFFLTCIVIFHFPALGYSKHNPYLDEQKVPMGYALSGQCAN